MLREAVRTQIQDIRQNGRQSAAYQIIKESVGPVRSAAVFAANRMSRGVLFPTTSMYFEPQPAREQEFVSLTALPSILDQVESRVGGVSRRSENFIGKSLYGDWTQAKQGLQKLVSLQAGGEGTRITDHVLSVKGVHVLFYEREVEGRSFLHPLVLTSGRSGLVLENIISQLSEPGPCAEIVLKDGLVWESHNQAASRNIAIENAVGLLQNQMSLDPGEVTVRVISSITNDFAPVRHAEFERDGALISNLLQRGGYSVGELQQAQLFLVQNTVAFDEDRGEVRFDPDLARVWIDMWVLAHPTGTEQDGAQALQKFVREKTYFELVSAWFAENPKVVEEFRNADTYMKHQEAFKDRNLSAHGLTETQTARAMLANYYLYHFEGAETLADSPSQKYLASIGDFHGDIASFLGRAEAPVPGLPVITGGGLDLDQREALIEVAGELYRLPNQQVDFDQDEKNKVVAEADQALDRIVHEIGRHTATKPIAEGLGLIRAQDTKLIHSLVSNLALARVPGEDRFTMSSWFPHAEGYLPHSADIFPFEREERGKSITEAVRHVFNGQTMDMGDGGSSNSAYESQVARIYEVGGQVLDFLQSDPRVPAKVREFIGTIESTDELKTKMLEVFCEIGEQNPLVVNRFFPDGFSSFQTMVAHRYVTDFLRGVESQIIKSTQKLPERISRRASGKWKNYDFSEVDEETIQAAIDKTLANGEHRINKMNHEKGTKKATLKDWQDFFERTFGWDTYEMKFLRWEPFWNVWNSVGPAWDCICFSRKPIFNTETIQQF